MHSCKQVRRILEDYLTGELLPSDREVLDQHLPSCIDCQALMDIHEDLVRLDAREADPAPERLRAMRSNVLAQISKSDHRDRYSSNWRSVLSHAPTLAAAAMLLIGIFLGSWFSQSAPVDDQLLEAITRQANVERSLDDSWEAPLFFSNVAVRDWSDKRVSLGFDVCRSVDLTTGLSSPVAGDILTHAILNSGSMGGRMRAMEAAALSEDARLTGALIAALQQDSDQTMRVAALNALALKQGNEQAEQAILGALKDDDSVQVRLLALEHVASSAQTPDTLEAVIRMGNEESNPAVFQRARELSTSASTEAAL